MQAVATLCSGSTPRMPGVKSALGRTNDVPHETRSICERVSCLRARRGAVVRVHAAAALTTQQPKGKPPHQVPDMPSGQRRTSHHGAPMSGSCSPLGAHFDRQLKAYNFALFSSTAFSVTLVLISERDLYEGRSTVEIALDPEMNRTGQIWHIAVPGVRGDMLYGYRVDGAFQSDPPSSSPATAGLRHDATRIMVDPYASCVVSRRKWGELGPCNLDYEDPDVLGLCGTWPQAAATLPDPKEPAFDWQGDAPLRLPMQDLVIYEAHVRGYTADPASGVRAPGTFQAMSEQLDYLADLGVTAIELLPVFEFNELEYYTQIPGTDMYRFNFWGYSTCAFFAPMARFAAGPYTRSATHEMKLLVREAHKRGMEVILDVVFNHTAEGNEMGPFISFRGVDNRTYYMLAPEGQYYNYSGCGNTFNCNNPVARQFILDCLRFWVQEYHVDGFRFDLASILTRAPSAWHPAEWAEGEAANGSAPGRPQPAEIHSGGAIVSEAGYMTDGAGVATGTPISDPPVVEMISEDPLLRNTKLIAEAWDCDGLNQERARVQVGAFPHYGGRWAEWNGSFRDTVRNFVKGTDGAFIGAFAGAIMGSPDVYEKAQPSEADWWGNNHGRKWRGGRSPLHAINFVTAHDGFTLADLVSYSEKHNEANGENNNDGESHNLSWNCGVEGPTDDSNINSLRDRQMRNHAAALLLAQGIPMILMGDEYGHTKHGNNNTYCHDSMLNYMDWNAARADAHGLRRFFKCLIRFRKMRPELGQPVYLHGNEVSWHGERLHELPDWEAGRFLALVLNSEGGNAIYIAFNTRHKAVVAELPERPGQVWRLVADTGKPAPYDFLVRDDRLDGAAASAAAAQAAAWTSQGVYAMLPWSCVILELVDEAEGQDVGGLDRWDAMRLPAAQVAGAPGTSSVDGAVAESLAGDVTLTFGEGIPNDLDATVPVSAAPESRQMAAASAQAPAQGPFQAAAAASASNGSYDGSDEDYETVSVEGEDLTEEDLELLANELLGGKGDLSALSDAEKGELFQMIRENLRLRKRVRP